MKISKSRIRQIIKESYQKILAEATDSDSKKPPADADEDLLGSERFSSDNDYADMELPDLEDDDDFYSDGFGDDDELRRAYQRMRDYDRYYEERHGGSPHDEPDEDGNYMMTDDERDYFNSPEYFRRARPDLNRPHRFGGSLKRPR